MHVVHFTTALSRCAAGVYEALIGFVTAHSKMKGVKVTVVGAVAEPLRWHEDKESWQRAGAQVIATSLTGVYGAVWFRNIASTMSTKEIDIVHAHGLWTGAALAASQLASRGRKPLVISPHGMLEPWAFNHRRLKKALPWVLWERGVVANASLIQAMSQQEAEAVWGLGLPIPAAIHPVGLDLRNVKPRTPHAGRRRTCLFLSRLHPKKGLPILLEAWARLRPQGWDLTIAGPDDNDHRGQLEAMAVALGVNDTVTFYGPVYGDEKWYLFSTADLFILPSYSENFGIVVAEAMAAGLPVIATTGTPWGFLAAKGVGWCVATETDAIEAALRDATTTAPTVLEEMGVRSAHLARDLFNWDSIALAMNDAYGWLRHGGPLPPCVVMPNPVVAESASFSCV